MSNTTLKRSMDLVKVELDSDSESQPETSSTETQETDLKQEKPPAPFAFVAVTEVVSAEDVRICNQIACCFPVMVPYFGVRKLQWMLLIKTS